jgi:hypothetical protein
MDAKLICQTVGVALSASGLLAHFIVKLRGKFSTEFTFAMIIINYICVKFLLLLKPLSSFLDSNSLFAWLISHQPAVLFSQNKPATSNQPAVLFSQNKPAPAISHQPNEQAENPGHLHSAINTDVDLFIGSSSLKTDAHFEATVLLCMYKAEIPPMYNAEIPPYKG